MHQVEKQSHIPLCAVSFDEWILSKQYIRILATVENSYGYSMLVEGIYRCIETLRYHACALLSIDYCPVLSEGVNTVLDKRIYTPPT